MQYKYKKNRIWHSLSLAWESLSSIQSPDEISRSIFYTDWCTAKEEEREDQQSIKLFFCCISQSNVSPENLILKCSQSKIYCLGCEVENCPLQILQETYISDVYNSECGPATGFDPFSDCRNGKDVLCNFAVGGNKYIG